MFIKVIWLRFKRFDHYQRAMLFAIPISLLLLLYLFIVDADALLLDEWFFDLMIAPAFVGGMLSGATYIGRNFDNFKKSSGKAERIGTLVGTLMGIGAAVLMAVLKVAMPFTGILYGLANAVFTLNTISSFGGIGNRIGSCIDDTRPKNERWAMGITVFIGAALGIFLVATALTAGISIMGITTFVTGGAALPAWIAGAIFVISFTSSLTSIADYSSKTINFIRSTYAKDKFHEYRGACTGIGVGVIVGLVIVAAIVMTQPYLFAGIMGIAAATLVVATCAGIIGGLFSRMGRFIDKFKSVNSTDNTEKSVINNNPTHSYNRHLSILQQKQQESLQESPPVTQDPQIVIASEVKAIDVPRQEKGHSSNPYLLMPKNLRREVNTPYATSKKFDTMPQSFNM